MRLRIGITLLLTASTAFAQQRFASVKLNFSVETPASNWRWTPTSELETNTGVGGTWNVKAPNGENFSVSTSRKGAFRLDDIWMKELEQELQHEGAKFGYHVEKFRHDRTTAPIYPSYCYAYTRVNNDGTLSYVDGYIAVVDRVYTLQYASHNRSLLSQFHSFIESFAVVDKFEAQRAIAMPASLTEPTAFPGMPVLGLSANLGVALAPNSKPANPPPPPLNAPGGSDK